MNENNYTLKQAAELCGVTPQHIMELFLKELSHFTQGKCYNISPDGEIIWTSKGLLSLSKNIDTDEAWALYEAIVDECCNQRKEV